MKLKIYRLGKTDFGISSLYQVFRLVRGKWTLLENCADFDSAKLYIFRVVAVDKGMTNI